MIHSFIIGVNFTDWWKGRPVTLVDHIVTSLGIPRICAQCVITVFLFVIRLLSNLNSNAPLAIGVVYVFFIYANFWLTSLLSIVFCLKISNFHSRLFLYLRGVIAHRTVYLIVAAVLLSALNCLMPSFTAITDWMRGGTYNTTIPDQCMDYINNYYTYSYAIGASIPLIFYCISSAVLFTSLYHHTRKMKMSSNLSINLESYYSVMKFVFFTFIYNTIYFISHFLSILFYFFYGVDLNWLYIVLEFLPVLHSSYLIYRTAKLRSKMSKVFQNVMNSFF
ncbi:hypothetical protein GDO78_017119 [Eleutherodactylus coqui]|uniref:Taste receptor type 2 n=1 Tax=Eleutherodactylus coqui TaxID=57060 RepID=A0A8J6BFA4_ELECQ|nr:hypothetical protein GDO78_017119 [Eleutherodactylus coqui]